MNEDEIQLAQALAKMGPKRTHGPRLTEKVHGFR